MFPVEAIVVLTFIVVFIGGVLWLDHDALGDD